MSIVTKFRNRHMNKNEISALMEQLFLQAKIRFGAAIKVATFHDRDECHLGH